MVCPKCGYTPAAKPPTAVSAQGAAAAAAPARVGSVNDLQPPPPRPAASAPQKAPPTSTLQLIGVLIYAIVLIGLVLAIGIARSEGTLAYAIGEVVGRSLIPLIVVSIYFWRRKPPASVGRYLFHLFGWVFLGNIIGLGLASRPDVTERDVPRLMREAAGLEPIRQPDNPARQAIRDVYRDLIQSQRAYEAQVKALQTPEGDNLLQAPSFDSAEIMQAELDHIEKMRVLETEQGVSLERFNQRMLSAIDGLNWSQSKKDQFKHGLRTTFERDNPFRKRVLDSELAWFAAMTEVYQFALERRDKLGVVAGAASKDGQATSQIVIQDGAVLAEFNDKMNRAEELRKQFLEANTAFQQNLKTNEKRMGLSRGELGLEQSK